MAIHGGEVQIDVVISDDTKAEVEKAVAAYGEAVNAILTSAASGLLSISNAYTSAFAATPVENPPSDPQVIEWHTRTQPPRIIANCPGCGQHVDLVAETFEIILPSEGEVNSPIRLRGRLRHDHEDGSMAAWPYNVEAPEGAARITVDDARATFARFEDADDREDVQEGQEHDSDEPFEFVPDVDGSLDLRNAVMQALGAASMCWEYPSEAGIFDPDRAIKIGEALLSKISEDYIRIEVQDRQARAWMRVAEHPVMKAAIARGDTGSAVDAVIARLDKVQADEMRLRRFSDREHLILKAVREALDALGDGRESAGGFIGRILKAQRILRDIPDIYTGPEDDSE